MAAGSRHSDLPMEQFVILIIIGLISLVNWVMQRSAAHKEAKQAERRADGFEDEPQRQEEAAAVEAGEAGDFDGQRRRFMEALGLPVDDPEPEIEIRREAAPPPVPEQFERKPDRNFLHKVSDDLERRLVPERGGEPPVVLAPVRGGSARRQRAAKPVAAPTDPGGPVDFLKDPGGLRRAVLAREVLGPCKGLDFELGPR